MKIMNLFYLFVILMFGVQSIKGQNSTKIIITHGIQNQVLKNTIEKNVSNFLAACNIAEESEKTPDFNKESTTSDARQRIMELWTNSPFKCTVPELEGSCLTRPSGGYQLRNIPIIMSKAPEKEKNQNIVINLSNEGKIDDIFIPLNDYATILDERRETEDLDVRLMVLDFVENFRTAYNRKDIKFLNTIFSENAVIITGKAIKPIRRTDSQDIYNDKAQFELQVKTKQEYLSSLKKVFKKNAFINVVFNDIVIVEHRNIPRLYGVTLRQDWESTTYADKGYVFLLIDYRNEQEPIITIRTWQPEEYNGRPLEKDEVFQISDFNVRQ